jgi:hypothetical protein
MQLVRFTAFRLVPCHTRSRTSISVIRLVEREELAVAQLASPLAYFSISPENFPIPPFLSSIYRTLYHALSDTSSHMHPYRPIYSLASNVLCRLTLILEIDPPTETTFVLGARGGHVACAMEMWDMATLNALVKDSLKKSTEGHHNAFARVESDCWVIL